MENKNKNYRVILPELGEGIDSAVIAGWNCKVGDIINKEDDIVEVVTDKATFNVPAGFSGKISELLVKEGEVVKIGEVLAIIEP